MCKPNVGQPDETASRHSVGAGVRKLLGRSCRLRFAVITSLLAALFCFSPANAKADSFSWVVSGITFGTFASGQTGITGTINGQFTLDSNLLAPCEVQAVDCFVPSSKFFMEWTPTGGGPPVVSTSMDVVPEDNLPCSFLPTPGTSLCYPLFFIFNAPGRWDIRFDGVIFSTTPVRNLNEGALGPLGYGVDVTFSPVPEPSSFWFMIAGLAGLAWKLRGRA
jgi:hypothetical protein